MIVSLNDIENMGGLRALRSVRTPTVLSGKRGASYSIGLAQAEELWMAAAAVSPLASPMLRYYALAQASRAVIASSSLGNQMWQSSKGHGLRFIVDSETAGLESVWVEQDGDGLAQKLAAALDSPVLEDRASLSELIAALPGQSMLRDTGCDPPRALGCRIGDHGSVREVEGILLDLDLPSSSWPLSWPEGSDEVRGLLEMYPTLRNAPRPVKMGIVGDAFGRPYALELGFDSEIPYNKDAERVVDIWVSPRDPFRAHLVSGWVLPAVGGNKTAQHPLVTWLLVLYGLSMLARYHPVPWRSLLDVDQNPSAVPLEVFIKQTSEGSMSLVELAIKEFTRRAAH